jgi:hypothetical protein
VTETSKPSPFDDGYWSKPKPDPTRQGDDDPDKIYCAVGRALAAWEEVEDQLSWTFITMGGASAADTAHLLHRSIGAIESTTAKISVIKAAADVYFRTHRNRREISGPLEMAMKAVLGASHRRNEIAHCRVKHIPAREKGTRFARARQDMGWFLIAPDYSHRHNKMIFDIDPSLPHILRKANYIYTSKDINAFREKFYSLSTELDDYNKSIAVNEFEIPIIIEKILQEDSEKEAARAARKAIYQKSRK